MKVIDLAGETGIVGKEYQTIEEFENNKKTFLELQKIIYLKNINALTEYEKNRNFWNRIATEGIQEKIWKDLASLSLLNVELEKIELQRQQNKISKDLAEKELNIKQQYNEKMIEIEKQKQNIRPNLLQELGITQQDIGVIIENEKREYQQ